MSSKLRVLARMFTRSLESGSPTHFVTCRSGWTLLPRQHFEQAFQFTLPLYSGMDVRFRLNVAPRHAWDFNFLATGQQNNSRAPHQDWNVRQTVD